MAVTNPDTSAVRAWARSNGYDVADRGRLPAELTDAYLAAQGAGSAKATAKPKTAKATKAPARKAAPARKPAARKAAPAKASTKAAAPAAAPAAPTAEAAPVATTAPKPAPATTAAEPKPKPVSDDRRLVALGEQLTALTARVAELEKAVGSKPSGNGVSKRFRRSR